MLYLPQLRECRVYGTVCILFISMYDTDLRDRPHRRNASPNELAPLASPQWYSRNGECAGSQQKDFSPARAGET
jgi:hypothetical protein